MCTCQSLEKCLWDIFILLVYLLVPTACNFTKRWPPYQIIYETLDHKSRKLFSRIHFSGCFWLVKGTNLLRKQSNSFSSNGDWKKPFASKFGQSRDSHSFIHYKTSATSATYNFSFYNFTQDICVRCKAAFVEHNSIFYHTLSNVRCWYLGLCLTLLFIYIFFFIPFFHLFPFLFIQEVYLFNTHLSLSIPLWYLNFVFFQLFLPWLFLIFSAVSKFFMCISISNEDM